MVRKLRLETAVWALGVLLAALAAPASRAADPEDLWKEIDATALDASRAVNVSGLKLQAGLTFLDIEEGLAYLATPVGGRVSEVVFQGRARLTLEPPDEIEAGQLDLFTGKRRLEEEVTEAVWVLASDKAVDAIARRPEIASPGEERTQRAEELFRRWIERPERHLLGVEVALFRDAVGDPFYADYFAGWFNTEEHGELLYYFEPDSMEQSTLGQFVPFEGTEKEKKRLARQIHKAQRKGRLLGLATEDLGTWDTWVSASRRGADGEPTPGGRPFEPKHYELDVTLSGGKLDLTGHARLHLEAQSDIGRVVKLSINSDLQVRQVAAGGEEVFFHQSGGEVVALLPEAPARGEVVVVEVSYDGVLVEKVETKVFALADTLEWYPHAGLVDLATYDVTLHWPGRRELVAPGKVVEEGKSDGGERFVRRRVERPTLGYTFEIGDFKTLTAKAGHVEVTLAVDALAAQVLGASDREEVLETVTASLTYFEESFGPYPLDELTVVTVPRAFSQSLLGFVTLSSPGLLDDSIFALLFGFEDRRTVIAHEVAHQWWGHQVPWLSYRDQWISEAMANYSAALYARNRLKEPPRIGPYTGWQRDLLQTTDDERTIESLGPLVLGERLDSSHSDGTAYEAIVYKKGAVVLEMLSRTFQEETFLKILRSLVKGVQFRPISTEVFIHLLERITHVELDDFARQFIFGTGLPEFFYNYEFSRRDDGTWVVEGTARQESPYRYRYFVVDLDEAPDVRRERLDQIEVAESFVVVPVELNAYDPKVGKTEYHKKNKLKPEDVGNVSMTARVVLKGASTQFRLQVPNEPKELFLDRHHDVFGRFFNERRHPKRMLFYQGLGLASAQKYDEAGKRFDEALAAPTFSGPVLERGGKVDERDLKAEGRDLDARIYLQLLRLALDQGDLVEARASWEKADELLTGSSRRARYRVVKNLEARLAIREGDPERAYKLLQKPVLRTGELDNAESALLLAVAAHLLGNTEDYEEALEIARDAGADVDALL